MHHDSQALGCPGCEDLPTGSSPSSRGGRTCSPEKMNYPRADSVGKADKRVPHRLRGRGGFYGQGIVLFCEQYWT